MPKRTTLDELGTMMAHVVKHMATKEDLERFATKDDLAAIEKRLDARIDGLKVKVDGIQNTLDREAMARSDQKIPERISKLEEKVFGHTRA
jgi:hypothetical protein